MSKEFDFEKQRRAAAKAIREMKETQPFIFREWQRLQQAQRAVVDATAELEAATKAWKNLGKK